MDEQEIKEQFDDDRLLMQGRHLSAAKASKLEQRLQANEHDWEARLLLIGYNYQSRVRPQYYELLAWLIDNRPTNSVHEWLTPPYRKTKAYVVAKRRWLRQLRLQPQNTKILTYIASYCAICEPRDAIKYLTQALLLEPTSEDLSLRLAQAFRTAAIGGSRYYARKAVAQLRYTVSLYKKRTDAHSYLKQYFEMLLREFSDLALENGLPDEATSLGKLLLKRKEIDSKRLGLRISENPYIYDRATSLGYSIIGRAAIAKGDIPTAAKCLQQMCMLPINSRSDWEFANELLRKKQKREVLNYLEQALCHWTEFLSKYDGTTHPAHGFFLVTKEQAERRVYQLGTWIKQIKKGRRPQLC
jgi:hypothetical protein